IAVIAKYAHGTPAAFPKRAGIVMISAATETAITALKGTFRRLRRRKSHHPGMPRSRENAYQVREALVSPAAPQKSWPIVAIRITIFAAQESSEVVKIEMDVPPASLTAPGSLTANRKASRTIQPAIAE